MIIIVVYVVRYVLFRIERRNIRKSGSFSGSKKKFKRKIIQHDKIQMADHDDDKADDDNDDDSLNDRSRCHHQLFLFCFIFFIQKCYSTMIHAFY